MIKYAKYFDSNKAMSFKVIDKKLLKKYTKIWGKISSLIGKEFESEPVEGDNDIYIKTKIKSHGDKVNTNFQGKEIPKESASYKSINQSNNQSIISQSINQSIIYLLILKHKKYVYNCKKLQIYSQKYLFKKRVIKHL